MGSYSLQILPRLTSHLDFLFKTAMLKDRIVWMTMRESASTSKPMTVGLVM